MEAAFFIIVLFIYLPTILGLISRHAVRYKFLSDTPLSYTIKKLNLATIEQRYLYSISGLIVFMAPLAIYITKINPGSESAKTIALGSLLFLLATSAAFILSSPLIRSLYKKYSVFFSVIITLSAAINLSMATSYAEGIITDLIGLRASELPTGLAWLTIIMTPVAWTFTLTYWSFAFYILALAFTALKESSKKPPAGLNLCAPVKTNQARDFTAGYAVALGFAMLAVAPLSFLGGILNTSWADRKIREQLVHASFHVKADNLWNRRHEDSQDRIP